MTHSTRGKDKAVSPSQQDCRTIKIAPHKLCCGCTACEQNCPQHCIAMQRDSEGFLYPVVDSASCIGCGKCEKVCPVVKAYPGREPMKAFAAISNDTDTRLKSSSGGIFSLLAEMCFSKGGVLFAARFDNSWKVVHQGTDRREDLSFFRGSKYVQSDMGNCLREAKRLLEEGRYIMFVGTPCQVAGLLHCIQKPSPNLLTVDFICHGVPSPAVWEWYVQQTAQSFADSNIWSRCLYRKTPLRAIKQISFRNKVEGWKQYHMAIAGNGPCHRKLLSEVHHKNPYMRTFLTNLSLRPSCHRCSSKEGKSHSDITLADFWNVHKVIDGYDDDKGTSLVLVNTEQGEQALSQICCSLKEVDFADAIQYNRAWSNSYAPHERRTEFFQSYKTQFDSFINRT